jgi:hypothetical protein
VTTAVEVAGDGNGGAADRCIHHAMANSASATTKTMRAGVIIGSLYGLIAVGSRTQSVEFMTVM